MRIVLIPLFVTSVIYAEYKYAIYIFFGAALTDFLDGMAARLRNQKTALGTFLDPLADKFLIVSSFILFSYYGWVPKWLTITVISRDVVVTMGWVLIFLTSHTRKVEPSPLGKTAVALELVLLSYVLLNIEYDFLPGARGALIWATASASILSGVHYIYMGLKQTANEK